MAGDKLNRREWLSAGVEKDRRRGGDWEQSSRLLTYIQGMPQLVLLLMLLGLIPVRHSNAFCPPGVAVRLRTYIYADADNQMKWPDPRSFPKLNFYEDFYTVLEVNPTIKAEDLKRAYYKIVFKYHPDNKEGEAAKSLCNKQMMVINNAYRILKDPEARHKYDEARRGGLFGNQAVAGGANSKNKKQKDNNPPVDPADDDYGFDWERAAAENMARDQRERGFAGFGADSHIRDGQRRGYSSDAVAGEGGTRPQPRRSAPFGFDVDGDGNLQPQRQRQRADGKWEVEPTPSSASSSRVQDDARDRDRAKKVQLQKERERVERDTRERAAAQFEKSVGRRAGGGFYGSTDDYSQYKDLMDFIKRGGVEAAAARESMDGNDARAAALQARISSLSDDYHVQKRLLDCDRRDWGEVTDERAISKRLELMARVKGLEERLAEAEDELLDFLMRQKEAKRAAARGPRGPASGGGTMGATGATSGRYSGSAGTETIFGKSPNPATWRRSYDRRRSGREEEEEGEEGEEGEEEGDDQRPEGSDKDAFLSEMEDLVKFGYRPPPRRRR